MKEKMVKKLDLKWCVVGLENILIGTSFGLWQQSIFAGVWMCLVTHIIVSMCVALVEKE